MTNEEAIRIAQGLITDFKCESDTMVDFCNTIIKALKQDTSRDLKEIEELSLFDLLLSEQRNKEKKEAGFMTSEEIARLVGGVNGKSPEHL